ncbi:MAG TPA: tRNA preQ1(34) S-adenosylmethionine ribosyltransferase-isomerase QueA [Candidatus Ozemobacteraceae bacterium]|nr:tRNA preQ1(34) S-adenosylmethionine ribosyltransferase-isomerase QueA [Candidatus Ozemobacteraceae bacterium]
MKTDLFDYHLPAELIAQVPVQQRPESRLLGYDRRTGTRFHGRFADLLDLIPRGDLLVLNASKVIPARLFTQPPDPGHRPSEILYLRTAVDGAIEAMIRPGRKFKHGSSHVLPGGCLARVESVRDDGTRVLRICDAVTGRAVADPVEVFRLHGQMPLPPYITSRESEPARYQTVYAEREGSVAAPTAGLHFDERLLSELEAKGVLIRRLHLHVGLGTFKPIEAENIEDHRLHVEEYEIDDALASTYQEVRRRGGRVWACGTTSVRSLESCVQADDTLRVGRQETGCYLMPGHRFRAVDHLITNFHLPRSSLLVLVSALVGRETLLDLYREAVEQRYRFFSFGDAMVII